MTAAVATYTSLQEVLAELANDPVKLCAALWPEVELYDKERQMLVSLWHNRDTVVPACHMSGKDFTLGRGIVMFFITRHPCRIITTSVDYSQLEDVLWGEIRAAIQTCAFPLDYRKGGPLVVNHMKIRKWDSKKGEVDALSYIDAKVAAKGEGMSGHHLDESDGVPRTLGVSDESSGVDQLTLEKMTEWAHRRMIVGNPYPCDNDFKFAVKGKPGTNDKGGDIPHPTQPGRFLRKVIKITAYDIPNIRLAMLQKERGIEPTGHVVVPGVLTWDKLLHRLATWDQVKITVGVNADFWEGGDVLLYPPMWLNKAEDIARTQYVRKREAKAIGIDPAEGGDNTAMAVVDEYGVIELLSWQTPDTTVIIDELLALGKKYNVPPEQWVFDRGGGKVHADLLKRRGFNCRTVGFGETVTPPLKRGMTRLEEREEQRAERYAYKNRRAQMYGILRNLLDPARIKEVGFGFGIPFEQGEVYQRLRRQLAVMPRLIDGEGRLYLPPKRKRHPHDTQPTLTDLIGYSPDEADAVVLAVFGMTNKASVTMAGAI